MSEIYSKADQVLIWVREHFTGGPASQNLLDFILELEDLITIIIDEHGILNHEAVDNHLVYSYTTYNIRGMFLRELLSWAWFVSLLVLSNFLSFSGVLQLFQHYESQHMLTPSQGRVWKLQEIFSAKSRLIMASRPKIFINSLHWPKYPE
jgi:hypothetical protein